MSLAHTRPVEALDEASMPAVLEALNALRVAITIFGADGRLIYANRHFNYMFRALPPHDELIGQRYEDLLRLEIEGGDLNEPDMPGGLEDFVAFRSAQMFSGDYAPRDIRLCDGRIVEIKTRHTFSGGWIALWSDVTHARRNLDRLHHTIALSADAFAFYDKADALVLCNEEYASLNGGATPEQLTGCQFAAVMERLADTITAEGRTEWRKRRNDIHHLPAGVMTFELGSGAAYLIRDRATGDGGRVVVFTDITEHRRAEKALAEQTRTLDVTRQALASSKAETIRQARYLADLATRLDQTAAQADSTKRTLLRTMSHELKTPLNAIIGFSDLLATLADRARPDQIREYAGLIQQGGNNLLRLINQILDLTKISAGRYELNRQKIDAAAGMWAARDGVRERADAKAIRIDAEACQPGIMIEVDENAFAAMLGQLIENAVHFTQEGGLVRLAAETADGRVRITVKDNGPGVASGDLERILEPFEQGGRAASDHSGGAGLGLTLVKALAELHGGKLSVASAPEDGFTATIELPPA